MSANAITGVPSRSPMGATGSGGRSFPAKSSRDAPNSHRVEVDERDAVLFCPHPGFLRLCWESSNFDTF